MKLFVLSICSILLSVTVKAQPAVGRPITQYPISVAKGFNRQVNVTGGDGVAGTLPNLSAQIEFLGPGSINKSIAETPPWIGPKRLGGKVEVYGDNNIVYPNQRNFVPGAIRTTINSVSPPKGFITTTLAINNLGYVFMAGDVINTSKGEINSHSIIKFLSRSRAVPLKSNEFHMWNQYSTDYKDYKILGIAVDRRKDHENIMFISFEDKVTKVRGIMRMDMLKRAPQKIVDFGTFSTTKEGDEPDDDDDDEVDVIPAVINNDPAKEVDIKANNDDNGDGEIDANDNNAIDEAGGLNPEFLNFDEATTWENGKPKDNFAGKICLDKNGNLYVADASLDVVVKITLSDDGKPQKWRIIGGNVNEFGFKNGYGPSALFHSPGGIAVDDDGDVYVSDTKNNCIRKINEDDGVVTTFCGSLVGESGSYSVTKETRDKARFNNPMGLAYDEKNNILYVADYNNKCIRKVNCSSGEVESLLGNGIVPGFADFANPTDVVLEPKGLGLYIADGGNFVKYLNLFKGGYTLINQFSEVDDKLDLVEPFIPKLLPPGVFFTGDGKFFGVPLRQWDNTLYTIASENNVGYSLVPGLFAIEVTCPPSDTTVIKDTIPFISLPYKWNKQTLNGSGTYFANVKTIQGCDSIVKLLLEVTPQLIYPYSIVASKDIEITPVTPITNDAGNIIMEDDDQQEFRIEPETGNSLIAPIAPISNTVSDANTAPQTGFNNFTISPPLPEGLLLDASTGTISGTPTVLSYDPAFVPTGPSTPTKTIKPWTLKEDGTLQNPYTYAGRTPGGGITSVKISDKLGNVLLNNQTEINSLFGTAFTQKAAGINHFYSDFSANGVTDLQQGVDYTIEVKNLLKQADGRSSTLQELGGRKTVYRNSFAICIDFNRDGDFYDPGEKIHRSSKLSSTAHTELVTFKLPKAFVPGVTKLRIHWMEKDISFITSGTYTNSYGTLSYGSNIIGINETDPKNFTPYPHVIALGGQKFDTNPYTNNDEPSPYKFLFSNKLEEGEFEDYSLNLIGKNGVDYTIKGTTANNLSDSMTVNIAVAQPSVSTTDLTICSAVLPYTWNGVQIFATGQTVKRLLNSQRADSAATLNLTVLQNPVSVLTISYCGPFIWNNQQITNTGAYSYKIPRPNRCDSFAALNFRQKATSFDTTIYRRPADLPYTGPNGLKFSVGGTKTLVLPNAEGCDSTYTLKLVVNYNISYPANNIFKLNEAITPIAPIIEGNYPFTSTASGVIPINPLPGGLQSFLLNNPGLSLNTTTGVISGTPTGLTKSKKVDFEYRYNGAQSPLTFEYTVGIPTSSKIRIDGCTSFKWNGTLYTETGVYEKRFINQWGFDSTATLDLTINQPTSSINTIRAAAAQLPFTWNGKVLTAYGDYTAILQNEVGCDSTITLHLLDAVPKIAYTAVPAVLSVGEPITTLVPNSTGGPVPSATGIVTTFSTESIPVAVAVDTARNIFFAINGGRLYKQTANGVKKLLLEKLGIVSAIATDTAGNVFIAHDAKISKYSTDGSFVTFFEPNAAGIAVDNQGDIYYTDRNSGVVKFDENLNIRRLSRFSDLEGYVDGDARNALFNQPRGMSIDAQGNVFVADKLNHVIRKISPSGVVSTYAGTAVPGYIDGSLTTALFNNPSSIVSDTYGNLFVIDQFDADNTTSSTNNPVIRQISKDGLVSFLAGSTSGYSDGQGSNARFSRPTSMAIDKLGYLYVTDAANRAIRVINTRMYEITPALPKGLIFDRSNGAISGTPLTTLATPVTYTIAAFNQEGVDSTTITLAICNPTPVSLNIDACDRHLWDGTVYTNSGIYTKQYTNIGGCDSVVTLNLTVKKSSPKSFVSVSACDSYTWKGNDYNETGLYYAHYTNAAGCDSTEVLDLAINICDSSIVFGDAPPMVTYPVTEKIFYKGILNEPVIPSNAAGVVPEMIFGERKVLMDAIDPTDRFKLDLSNAGTISSPVKDLAGNYFFLQYEQYRILKLSPNGTISIFAGTGKSGNNDGPALQASFANLSGEMVVDKEGNLFVADNKRIRKITPDGIVSSVNTINALGSTGDGPLADAAFRGVSGLAFDKKGNLLFTEQLGDLQSFGLLGRVRKIDFTAGTVTTVLSGLNSPGSIVVDIYGNIVFAEVGIHKIKKITPGGLVYTIAGNGSYGDDESGFPILLDGQDSTSQIGKAHSLSVDRNNSIYFINGSSSFSTITKGSIGRIDGTGYVSEILYWFPNKQNNIIRVRDGKLLMYNQKQIVETNVYGYGYTQYPNYVKPNIDRFGNILPIDTTDGFYGATITIASNAAGISKFPINLFYRNLIQINEKRTTSSLPYTWRGKTVTGYTDTVTYLSPNSLNSGLLNYGDTLFRLILVNEAPTPTINFTADCVSNAVVLQADGAGGNAMYFNGSNVATFPRTKNGKALTYYAYNLTEISDAPSKFKAFPATAFEAWIKPTSVAGLQYIAAIDTVETAPGFMGVLINNGKLEYRLATQTSVSKDVPRTPVVLVAQSSTNLQAGVWTHVSATYYDSTMYVYINGVLSGSTKNEYSFLPDGATVPFKKDQNFIFGGLGATQNQFKGSMDEIRWWAPKTERIGADILANMNKLVSSSSPGLVLNYRFDEADGDSLIDNSSSNRSAKLINAPVLEPSTVPISYDSYLWSPGGETTPSITSNNRQTSTKYIVTVTDYKGTAGKDSLELPVILKSSTTDKVSVCATSYTWHDNVYTQSINSATWTGKNKFGCDSVVTLHLTLLSLPVPVISANGSTNLCKGGAITLSTGNFVNYSWSDGASAQLITVSPAVTTTYTVSVKDANGCSGTASTTVYAVLPTASTETIAACSTYTWHGKTYTASNFTDTWTGVNSAGCDSVVTLNLTINSLPTAVIAPANDAIMCGPQIIELTARAAGNAVNFGGKGFLVEDSMGVTPAAGFTLEAWVKMTALGSASTIMSQVNKGKSLPFDSYVNEDGTVSFEVGNASSSSTITTTSKLAANKWQHLAFVYSANTMRILIDGVESAAGAAVAPSSGISSNFMIGNRTGFKRPMNGRMDEVRVWNIAKTQPEISDAINRSVEKNSYGLAAYYTFDDTTANFLLNSVKRESTAILVGATQVASSAPIDYANYQWQVPGNPANATIYAVVDGSNPISVNITDINGCKNVISTIVKVNKPSATTETVKACGSYSWHDSTYTSSTNTATWTTTNAAGCDSVVTLQLTVGQPTYAKDKIAACNAYVWHGQTYYLSNNSATWVGVNAAGCDSVVTLNLTLNRSVNNVQNVAVCGDTYTWHDSTYTTNTSSATWIGSTLNGCDSIVTLNLKFITAPEVNLNNNRPLNLCQGDSVILGESDFTQYASAANSRYFNTEDSSYLEKQVIGKADKDILILGKSYPEFVSRGKEYLELTFPEARNINFIYIDEALAIGGIDTVFIKNPDTESYEVIYTSSEALTKGSRTLPIRFPLTSFPVNNIKITMTNSLKDNYKGIDAVSIGVNQNANYLWSDGSKGQTLVVKNPGMYSLTATNNNGCITKDSVEVKTVAFPTISSDAQTICSGAESSIFTPADLLTTRYYWNYNYNPDVIGIDTVGNGLIAGNLINNNLLPQTIVFQIIPENNNCLGELFTKTVTIRTTYTTGAINTGGETICSGGNPSLIGSVTASSGGDGSIEYKWQANGVDIANSNAATYDPPAGLTTTTIYTRYAKDGSCTDGFTQSTGSWMVTVQSIMEGSIAGDQTICYGGDPAAFTSSDAGTSNGAITYRWEVKEGAGAWVGQPGSLATLDIPNGLKTTTQYRRIIVSTLNGTTCESIPSNTVTVTVNNNFTPGAIQLTGEFICSGGNPSLIGSTTTASGGDGNITYKWQANGVDIVNSNAATYDPPAGLKATTTYTRFAKDATCNMSFAKSAGSWVVTVYGPASVSSNATNNTICIGGTATLSVAGALPAGASWKWSKNSCNPNESENNLGSTVTLNVSPNVTTTYYVKSKDGACATTDCISITITVSALPAAPTVKAGSRCGPGTVMLIANVVAGTTVDWYNAATGGSIVTGGSGVTSFTTPVISTNTTYYAQRRNTTTGCISATRTAVTATVNALPNLPTAGDVSRCGTGTLLLTATPSTGATVAWFATATGGTALSVTNTYTTASISTTTTYYVESRSGAGCVSAGRKAVLAIISPIPAAPTTKAGSRCGPGSVTLSASTAVTGATIEWYGTSTSTTLLGTGSSFVTPSITVNTTYYAAARSATRCLSGRSAVAATINPLLAAASTLTGTTSICSIVGTATGATYTASAVTGAVSYSWTIPAGALIDSGSNGLKIKVRYTKAGASDSIYVQAIGTNGCAGAKKVLKLVTTGCVTPNAVARGASQASLPKNPAQPFGAAEGLSVYPNPSNTLFNVTVTASGREKVRLRMMDAQGVVLKTITMVPSTTIKMGAELRPGVYFFEVILGTTTKVVKAIKL